MIGLLYTMHINIPSNELLTANGLYISNVPSSPDGLLSRSAALDA